MKSIKLLLFMLTITVLVACNKNDEFDGEITVFDPPVLGNSTPQEIKIKQIFDTYGVIFKPIFPLSEYTWNWETSIAQTEPNVTGMRYTPAKMSHVIPVIDSVDKWVFKIFPANFSTKYLPLNILLTDTLGNKYLSGTNIVHRFYEGNIATNYIALSYVSERFDVLKNGRMLRESWLSLFVEKILTQLPYPNDFALISTDGYAKLTFTNAEDVAAVYGILKKGRTKQNSATATAAWNKTTPAQDFGDFVSFLVFTPDAEKQTVYAKNTRIKTKADIVKNYFLQNFGITLPYYPTNP